MSARTITRWVGAGGQAANAKGRPRSRAGSRRPQERRGPLALLIVAARAALVVSVLVASSLAAAPVAADDDPFDQTDWTVNDDPILTGPSDWWKLCEAVPAVDGDCFFTLASGGDPEPTNCAIFPMGPRVGVVEVMAHIPAGSTANARYRLEYTVANTGEPRTYDSWLDQSESGWRKVAELPWGDTPAMTVNLCDSEAAQHHEVDGAANSRIGVDAIAMRCIDYCDAPPPQPPTGLDHRAFDYLVTEVSWDEDDDPTRAGFLVTYSRDTLIGDPAAPELEPWTSPEFRTYGGRHRSPELGFGLWYRVEVRTVDVFGRVSEPAARWFEQEAPSLPLHPEVQNTDTWLDHLERAAESARLVLDGAGVLDPTPISDGASGAISLFLGDFDEVGISFISAGLPYVGDAAKLGKVAKAAKSSAVAKGLTKAVRRTSVRVDYGSLNTSKTSRAALKSADELADYTRYTNHRFRTGGPGSALFETDDLGRPLGVTVHRLRLVEGGKPDSWSALNKHIRTVGEHPHTDDAGHILGRRFEGGVNEPYNLFPQLYGQNQSAYKRVENYLERLAKRCNSVGVDIKLMYAISGGMRPQEVLVTPIINHNPQPVLTVSNLVLDDIDGLPSLGSVESLDC